MTARDVEKITSLVETWIRSAGGIILAIITLFVFEEVIARYIFKVTHAYIAEWTQWGLVWITWLFAFVILIKDKHIKVDFLLRLLPKAVQSVSLSFTQICTLAFFVSLLYSGIRLTQTYIRGGITSPTSVATPLWVPNLIIPIIAFVLVLAVIVQISNMANSSNRIRQEGSDSEGGAEL